ncbi:MAG: hypothetical protein JW927_16540 [Deltaproteobacteria bacterium]|nr:hypothetical protein [Deltaproteobacteria bacterium]
MLQNDSQLVVRDIPLLQLVFGILFVGVGALVVYSGGPLIFGAIFAAIGLCFLLFSSIITITADRMTQTFNINCRSPFRHTLTQLPFNEIDGINVERRVSSNRRGFTYRLTLLRKDGEIVPFRATTTTGWKGKERQAEQLREFLGIKYTNRIPSGILPRDFSRLYETHETNGVQWQIEPMYTATSSVPTGARWHSPDFKTPGIFLFVAQKAEGQSSQGFLASLGSMFIRQALSLHGFSVEDTPGLQQAKTLAPLEPALERHFMAYTNSPSEANKLLNSTVAAQLVSWSERYPLKQLQRSSCNGQLMMLFGPNGVFLVTMSLGQSSQVYELISMGVELVKTQNAG